jgi:hypothetical protein
MDLPAVSGLVFRLEEKIEIGFETIWLMTVNVIINSIDIHHAYIQKKKERIYFLQLPLNVLKKGGCVSFSGTVRSAKMTRNQLNEFRDYNIYYLL